MWLARNKSGSLYLFSEKPFKAGSYWISKDANEKLHGISIFIHPEIDKYPEVKWEDEEPRELVLKPIKGE